MGQIVNHNVIIINVLMMAYLPLPLLWSINLERVWRFFTSLRTAIVRFKILSTVGTAHSINDRCLRKTILMNLSLSVSLFHQLSLAQNCPLFQMEAYCRHHARHLVVNTKTSVRTIVPAVTLSKVVNSECVKQMGPGTEPLLLVKNVQNTFASYSYASIF